MTSYKNFQSDNFKHTKDISRSDINNPNFNSMVSINQNDLDSFTENLNKWTDVVSFYRWYPDLWYDLITPEKGGIRLDLDQRVTMRSMARFFSVYGVFPRGYGKTMLELMVIYHACVFFPGIEISMSAQTKENAASISESKHREIEKFYPLIKNEFPSPPKSSKDNFELKFNNGSFYSILANAQSSKGQRKVRIVIEESALLNNELYMDCLQPIANIPRRTVGGKGCVNPIELNGSIHFVTTSGYRGSTEFERNVSMINGMANGNGQFVIGADWRLPCYYGRGETKSQIMKKKNDPTQSAVAFSQNYGSKWVGSTDGSIVNINKLMNLRTLTTVELGCKKDKNGKHLLYEYVIGVDVARSESTSNNKSAIVVLKIIRSNAGRIRQIQVVNIITPPNGLNFTQQSILVRKIFYSYGGTLDVNTSRVKAIVVDGNVIGKGLIDRLLENITDPETNEELGCFSTINTDQKAEDIDAPPFIYDLKAQGINGDIIRIFIDNVENERLKLLSQYQNITSDNKDKFEVELACIQTQLLIDEISNLKLNKTDSGNLTVRPVVKKIDKDRYSALVYALYYIKLFLEKEEETNSSDDFLFFMQSGF